MENEYMKRGYLLPEGCKDLIDVMKSKSSSKTSPPTPFPPITGEITVPAQLTVAELSAVLAQKPFRIIADLMQLGVFASIKQQIDFDTISRVVRKYGFVAKRAV